MLRRTGLGTSSIIWHLCNESSASKNELVDLVIGCSGRQIGFDKKKKKKKKKKKIASREQSKGGLMFLAGPFIARPLTLRTAR